MGNVRFASGLESLFVPINSVRQHPQNPRNGDLDVIIESIRVNGYVAPIIAQRSTGYIIAGNHRWQALHALGSDKAPVLFVDYTDEQAKRYLLVDNASSDKARNDDALMVEMLKELQGSEAGLVGSGFTDDELNRLIAGLDIDPLPETPHPVTPALHGIYEVTVTFDNTIDRTVLMEELKERFGEENVREANI